MVGLTLTAVILRLPLPGGLGFDFNPLNLRSKDVESVSTLLDLMRDPDTSPNTIDILESDLPHASALSEKLSRLPEVSKVRTLLSFVPKDQDEKLAIIDDASFFFENTLSPEQVDTARPRLRRWRRSTRRREIFSTLRPASTAPPPCRRAAWRAC